MLESGKIRHFLVFFGMIAVFYFVTGSPRAEAAASIYVAPDSGTFIIGSTFSVSVYLNTGGEPVNAVEAHLSFPPDKLQVVSPTAGKSLIQVWVGQPSYDNLAGTLKFQGTVPNPGINTDAGLISTVTFRVKGLGTAVLKFSDGSQVLLNDGKGTDILGQTTDGVYYFVLPPPAGPIVASRTNPDQDKWYNDTRTAVLEWNSPPDAEGYSYILDQDPAGEPDNINDGTKTRVVYNNLADGVYYFHIKALRQGSWGGITDYILKIDNTPPADFGINVSPGETTTNHRPIIDFGTTDQASGIDHYEIKIIPLDVPAAQTAQNQTPFFIEVAPPYSPELSEGRYQVIARAFDKAGNYTQAETRLDIVKPLFEIISGRGIRLAGAFLVPWAYAGPIALVLLALLAYFAFLAWRWHREIEEHLRNGPARQPDIAAKLEELKAKQKEYGSSGRGDGEAGGGGGGYEAGKALLFALAVLWLGFAVFASKTARAQTAQPAPDMPLTPPLVTLFPKSLSNDEILYIGGRADSPQAAVLIYLQDTDSGSTLKEAAFTDKNGSWFYSFPNFLGAGHYSVWTQLKAGEELSPTSSRMDLTVAPTAVQFGANRLSFETLYFALFLVFAVAFIGLIVFSVFHARHAGRKNRRLKETTKEAEESIRRGFSVIRRDIESELELIRRLKLKRNLSEEEQRREEKLLKDLDDVSGYIGKEIWQIENM